jgi:hypothetical protein
VAGATELPTSESTRATIDGIPGEGRATEKRRFGLRWIAGEIVVSLDAFARIMTIIEAGQPVLYSGPVSDRCAEVPVIVAKVRSSVDGLVVLFTSSAPGRTSVSPK